PVRGAASHAAGLAHRAVRQRRQPRQHPARRRPRGRDAAAGPALRHPRDGRRVRRASRGGAAVTPEQYRSVPVTGRHGPLTEEALWDLLRDRQAYRRTRYVVARHGEQVAVAELDKPDEVDLFVDIVGVRLLAGPDETVLVERPE